MASSVASNDWERMDKLKFFGYGTMAFSTLTCVLYPASTVKTILQVEAARGAVRPNPVADVVRTVRRILATEGPRGLYKGLGAVLGGALPARIVYLGVLEKAKSVVSATSRPLELSPASQAALCNSLSGLSASLATQAVVVPMDVVSSRLQVQPSAAAVASTAAATGTKAVYYRGPVDAVRQIVASEGVLGLYRGFTMSILTYAPSSAVWWGSYGTYKSLLSRACGGTGGRGSGQAPPSDRVDTSIQMAAGFCAGLTSGTLTNPLDVIKTRLQVLTTDGAHGDRPTIRSVAGGLWQQQGAAGFMRGIVPRTANVCLWGTSMVVVYESLKALSMRPE